jgi:hypothetical protein
MRKTNILLPEHDDHTLLSHLAKGAFRVASYCDGKPFPGGDALVTRLDSLVEQGLAKLIEQRGERDGTWGDVWSVFEITPLGRRKLKEGGPPPGSAGGEDPGP